MNKRKHNNRLPPTPLRFAPQLMLDVKQYFLGIS